MKPSSGHEGHEGSDTGRAREASADRDVVEVVLMWGDPGTSSVLATKYLRAGESFSIGEGAGCDAVVPYEALGEVRADVVVCDEGGTATVIPPRGAHTWVDAFPVSVGAGGASDPVALTPDTSVDVRIGAFAIRARIVPDELVATSWTDAVRGADLGGIAASALVHISLFAAVALFMPSLGATDQEDISRDQLLTMRHLLDASAMREDEAKANDEAEEATTPEDHGASGGGRAIGQAGAMGTPIAPRNAGHWTAKGDTPRDLATLSRAEKMAMVEDFGGMLGLLASLHVDPNAPTVPWGEVLSGSDRESHLGALFGPVGADSFGIGGLTLGGIDEGGGGSTLGVGINDIGGLSASLDRRLGSNDPGGWGHGCGGKPCLVGGTHKTPFNLRMPREITTNGRLPGEIIQRIVRQHMGMYRACYEGGLRTNPSLEGRVVVKFMIDRTGQVSMAQDGGSDLPNDAVNRCIVQSFYSLSFPTPDSGSVTVTYPIVLTPAS